MRNNEWCPILSLPASDVKTQATLKGWQGGIRHAWKSRVGRTLPKEYLPGLRFNVYGLGLPGVFPYKAGYPA